MGRRLGNVPDMGVRFARSSLSSHWRQVTSSFDGQTTNTIPKALPRRWGFFLIYKEQLSKLDHSQNIPFMSRSQSVFSISATGVITSLIFFLTASPGSSYGLLGRNMASKSPGMPAALALY